MKEDRREMSRLKVDRMIEMAFFFLIMKMACHDMNTICTIFSKKQSKSEYLFMLNASRWWQKAHLQTVSTHFVCAVICIDYECQMLIIVQVFFASLFYNAIEFRYVLTEPTRWKSKQRE